MSTGDETRLGYRPGVGVMLLNGEGRVFAGQRIDSARDAWQMPQGGIEPGEEPREAAMRELKEEIGTNKAKLLAESRGWFAYDLPAELAGTLWGGRYRGQRQKWFAMRFTGAESDIDIHTAHPEFRAWRWLAAEDLPGLIVPFKRALYEAVLAEFRHLVVGPKKPA